MGSPARGNQGENRETLNGFEAPSSPFINGDVCVYVQSKKNSEYISFLPSRDLAQTEVETVIPLLNHCAPVSRGGGIIILN